MAKMPYITASKTNLAERR